jgi:hypothetical protein
MRTKNPWGNTTAGEAEYARDLRGIAKEIGKLINRYNPTDISQFPLLRYALEKYTEILRPWAALRAKRLVDLANRKNKTVWAKVSKEMGAGLKRELQTTPVGARVQELMNEQVKLITSLPKEAGDRERDITLRRSCRVTCNAYCSNRSITDCYGSYSSSSRKRWIQRLHLANCTRSQCKTLPQSNGGAICRME